MLQTEEHIVLKTENLSIGYHQKKETQVVLSDINLNIESGKLITVIGQNGAGKSTLLRTLAKIQPPISGEIFIHQKKLKELSEKQLSKKLSLVLTERLPESQLTVFELIALGRQPYTNWMDTLSDEDLQKVNLAIKQTEIESLANKRFYELSDGQLQKVLIARALAQDTEIIILDEPTAHLDMHHKVLIFSLLKKLVATTNKAIIVSTHEINLAIQLADKILLFTENKLFSGSPKELITNNAFDNLFPKEIVKFNSNLQQFVINKS